MTLPEARRMWERAMDNVRERAAHCVTHHAGCDCREYAHAREVAELLEVARAVATQDVLAYEGDAGDNIICPFCGGESHPRNAEHPIDRHFRHEPGCIVLKARKLVVRYEGKE